jgi:hypothetical protein
VFANVLEANAFEGGFESLGLDKRPAEVGCTLDEELSPLDDCVFVVERPVVTSEGEFKVGQLEIASGIEVTMTGLESEGMFLCWEKDVASLLEALR